jgi:hypothetical protein
MAAQRRHPQSGRYLKSLRVGTSQPKPPRSTAIASGRPPVRAGRVTAQARQGQR